MRHTITAPRAGLGAEYAASPQARRVLRNTYLLLGVTMLPTVAGAFAGAAFPLMAALGWMSLLVFLGAMFGLQAMVIRNRHSMAGVGWLMVFTFVMGYFVGPLLGTALGSYSNGAELVAMAIGGTAALFLGLAGYATATDRFAEYGSASTRKFISMPLGKFLFIGMWMAFILSIVNSFLLVSSLGLAISAAFIVIASGFILFTVKRVVDGGQDNYILAAMTLYIMLLNLFQSLLHLLMAFAGNRE